MALAHYTLVLLGVVYAISQAALTAPFRRMAPTAYLRALISCPACTGFWVGLCLAVLWPFPSEIAWIESALGGMAISALWGTWGPRGVDDEAQAQELEDEHD